MVEQTSNTVVIVSKDQDEMLDKLVAFLVDMAVEDLQNKKEEDENS